MSRIPFGQGRKEGLDSKSGVQWEGRGHVPVYSRMAAAVEIRRGGGWSRRVRWGQALLSSHSQLPGPGCVGGRGQENMPTPPQTCQTQLLANADSEAEPLPGKLWAGTTEV